jgi:hypothetical protein
VDSIMGCNGLQWAAFGPPSSWIEPLSAIGVMEIPNLPPAETEPAASRPRRLWCTTKSIRKLPSPSED